MRRVPAPALAARIGHAALGRRPERRPAAATRALAQSNTCSNHCYGMAVPTYVLRYASADRRQVEQLIEPYPFKPNEVSAGKPPASLNCAQVIET